MSIGVGIVGHGFMGHEHEKMVSSMEGYHIVGICDICQDKHSDVREGIIRYNSAEEMYRNPDIDVVIIAANNNQHLELVIKAAEAGKDIICEKPVAMSPEELEMMEEAADKYQVKFTVHQQRRLDRDFRIVKELYDNQMLGNIYTIETGLYGYNGNMHDWHIYKSEGGGMLYDWGVHLLDQILFMVDDKITSVYAEMRNVINEEVDDYFKILLRFSGGLTAEIKLGTYILTDRERWYERHWMVCGDKGCAYIDGFDPDGKIVRTTRLLENVGKNRTMGAAGPTRSFGTPEKGLLTTEPLPEVHTAHEDYFINYRNAYAGNEEFMVKIPEVRRVLRLMDAVRESALSGQSIAFES